MLRYNARTFKTIVMKNLIFKIFRWIAGMIGVTVAASCDSVDDLISAPEYGVPYAAFEVKCKVVTAALGNDAGIVGAAGLGR